MPRMLLLIRLIRIPQLGCHELTSSVSFTTVKPQTLSNLQLPGLVTLTLTVLSTIAFQYYPLDLSASSNPFIVSWWPLALADPALFHVSIQTASLDEELRAQKGFPVSEMLMVDSVALVRRKIGDAALAFQDETLNSVVTLAAIEVSMCELV